MKSEILSESSSGNIFADLGLPDAEVLLAKNLLADAISNKIKEEQLTQRQLAKNVGMTEARISKICGYQTDDVSLEAMVKILAAMDYDVLIDVQKRRKSSVTRSEKLSDDSPSSPEKTRTEYKAQHKRVLV